MYDWKKIILKIDDNMRRAIEVLNEESLRIVLVADKRNKLLGTVTDGDIRRAMIQKKGLETPLGDIMHQNPTTVSKNHSREKILAIMQREGLLQLPVINETGVIVGLKSITNTIQNDIHDNVVFLMAGGFGTRLKPLTDSTPKPLLMIGRKPILEIILDQFIEAGFYNFVISTHYKAEMFHNYFGDGDKWNVNIDYVHEDSPMGTAGALGLLRNDFTDLPILVMNGDLLTKVNFENFLKFHNKNDGIASMCVRGYDMQVPYGVINSSNHKLTGIVEKPVNKYFVNAGIYIINPLLLENLDGKTYIDMPDLLQKTINDGEEVNVFPLHEYWLDIGQLEQLKQAQKDSKNILGW